MRISELSTKINDLMTLRDREAARILNAQNVICANYPACNHTIGKSRLAPEELTYIPTFGKLVELQEVETCQFCKRAHA